MDTNSLLHVLSPQLQALVEASLGEPLPGRNVTPSPTAQPRQHEQQHEKKSMRDKPSPTESATLHESPAAASTTVTTAVASSTRNAASLVKLNPAELFVLQHPASPGFVVKERFLGTTAALAARDALAALATTEQLRDARVGHGASVHYERAVRGDRILWLPRPRDLRHDASLAPAIAHLLQRIESVVFSVKAALAPTLDIRNVTSTQLAVFPGDGSRFVRHTDTMSNAHSDDANHQQQHLTQSSNDDLVRLMTCVYYLNSKWEVAHGGALRVFTSSSSSTPPTYWDIPPALDTLVVFRSCDVEHEVLPTFHDRMALTVWYYGRRRRRTTSDSNSDLETTQQTRQQQPPVARPTTPVAFRTQSDTIFVAIPSYRDSELRFTVDSLFEQAHDRQRIVVGICLQLDLEQDDDPRPHFATTYSSDHVRVAFVHSRNAAGPCVARALAQSLYRNEAFYLQVDSHMRFRRNWDLLLLDDWRKCPHPNRSILTTYPLGYTLPNTLANDTRPTLLCATAFDAHGMLRQASKTLAVAAADAPIPSAFWAAGFAFSGADVITKVPYDASLRFLFFGEEASMSARLWTAGYDFYAPREAVVYHLWTRAHRPVFQENDDDVATAWRNASQRFVQQLLRPSIKGGRDDDDDDSSSSEHTEQATSVDRNSIRAGTHGLGTMRSLDAYAQHIGVDFAQQHVSWAAQWGHVDPMRFALTPSKATGIVAAGAAANASMTTATVGEHAPV